MNRRDFLKGTLAGATVTAVPGIGMIVNQLPKATESMVNDGEWHHMVYTKEDEKVTFSLDNVQMIPVDGFSDVEYRGALSDVVVYDRQLTVSDIKKLHKRWRL